MNPKDLWGRRRRSHDAGRRTFLTWLPSAVAGSSLVAYRAEPCVPAPERGRDDSGAGLALGFVLYGLGQLGLDTHAWMQSVPEQLLRLGREEEIEEVLNDLIRAHNHAAQAAGPEREVMARIVAQGRIPDPGQWLAAWRRRLGIGRPQAASLLGYADEDRLAEAEAGGGRPCWDKVVVAMWLEALKEVRHA